MIKKIVTILILFETIPNKCIFPTICWKTGLQPFPHAGTLGVFWLFLTEILFSSITGPCCRSRSIVACTTFRKALSLAEVTNKVRRLSMPKVSALHFPCVSISVRPWKIEILTFLEECWGWGRYVTFYKKKLQGDYVLAHIVPCILRREIWVHVVQSQVIF